MGTTATINRPLILSCDGKDYDIEGYTQEKLEELILDLATHNYRGNHVRSITIYQDDLDEDGELTGRSPDIFWEGEAMTHDQYYTEYERDDETGEDNHEEIVQEYIDFYEELKSMPTVEQLNQA